MSVIAAHNLSKNYNSQAAVKSINFTVEQNEVFGLLGPNGAGKTTTINMLTGLIKPSEGEIFINNFKQRENLKQTQKMMGIVPDESNLYPELTGWQNLIFCASLYGVPPQKSKQRALDLLEKFNLDQDAHKLFRKYSRGMKRKLTIACALIHQPKILFLDEPTTGIDLESAHYIRELIQNIHQEQTTVLLTTHYIEEAERLCSRIAFIVQGQLIKVEDKAKLLAQAKDEHILQLTLNHPLNFPPHQLKDKFANCAEITVKGQQIVCKSSDILPFTPIISFLEAQGCKLEQPEIPLIF